MPNLGVVAVNGAVFGVKKTNTMCEELSSNINALNNRVVLDRSIRARLDSGNLFLTSRTIHGTSITMANCTHKCSNHLKVSNPNCMNLPEVIQSTRIVGLSRNITAHDKSKVSIIYDSNIPVNRLTVLRQDNFELHSVLLWLKQVGVNLAAAEVLAKPFAKPSCYKAGLFSLFILLTFS